VKNDKSISVSTGLYQKLEKRAGATGFKSVAEYVTFILEQVVEEEAAETGFTTEEEAEVKKRLKALGYIE
jgi:hypothetical protein